MPISRSQAERASTALITMADRPITLEAEVASSQIQNFIRSYKQWSSSNESWQDLNRKKAVFDMGSGKWGSEYRIYFPKNQYLKNQLERHGFMVEEGGVRHKGTFRINNRVLFQVLVEVDGLQLGKNY